MPLRTAILGFSETAEKLHVPALNGLKDKFIISAASASSGEDPSKAVKALEGATFYPDGGSLLEREKLDAVILTGAAGKNLILKALNCNLDVLCEGPLSLGLSELDEILDKSRQRNKIVYFFDWWKHHPQIKAVAEAVSQDILGKADFFQLSVFSRDRDAPPGMAEWNGFHILNMLSDKKPITAFSKFQDDGTSDTAISFLDGAAQVHISPKSRFKKVCATISGEKGLLSLNDDRMTIEREDLGRKAVEFAGKFWEFSEAPALAGLVYRDFEKALGDASLAEKNIRDTSLCLRLLAAARKSSRSGKQVPV